VIDALFGRLDVSVQHGHIGTDSETVCGAMDVEVALGAAFVMRDLAAHAFGENFSASARQRVEACRYQLAQDLLVAHAV